MSLHMRYFENTKKWKG